MREHTIVVQDQLRSGLRSAKQMSSGNTGTYLSLLLGLTPSENGLENPRKFEELNYSGEPDFPFPMVFNGTEEKLIVHRNSLVIGTEIPVYNMQGSEVSFSFSEAPEFLDLGRVWLLTDGNVMLFRQNIEGTLGQVKCLTSPKIETACYHKGRVLIGGASDVSNMWKEDSDRLVFWSSIGGGDAFEPFLGELREDTEDGYPNRFYRVLDQNLVGWCNPGVGKIIKLHPLDQHVVVFGLTGIAVLMYNQEGPGAYGQAKLLDLGIADKRCITGDQSRVFFKDSQDDLWVIQSDMKIQRLGYKEFLSTLDNPIGTYISGFQELYLTDGFLGFVLTPNGMAGSRDRITSVLLDSGDVKAVKFGSEGDDFLIRLDGIDFSRIYDRARTVIPGYKKLTFIHVSGEGISNVKVRTAARGTSVINASFVPCNDSFVAYSGVSAKDFTIDIIGQKTGNFSAVNCITLRFQIADSRSFRSF